MLFLSYLFFILNSVMESNTPQKEVQEAVHVEAAEDGGDQALKQTASAVIAGDTAFVAFTRWEAIKYFWWPVLLCMVATLACMNDGFQNQLPGSLISNQGFINQFGTEFAADGSKALAASWVSIWGAMMPVGQVPGSLFAGWINDRVGRRGGMCAMTAAYLVVSPASLFTILLTKKKKKAKKPYFCESFCCSHYLPGNDS